MPDDIRGTVIFDLDGTLVDSAPDLAAALDIVLVEQGLAPVGLEGTRALIGHGIAALVRGALGQRGCSPGEAEFSAVLERFLHLYGVQPSAKTKAYPGVGQALAALRHAGWRLVVCTNKREDFSRRILKDLGLLPEFDVIAGPDTFGVSKPDPAHLTRTLPQAPPGPHLAIVVGDSAVDVAAARAAGLPVIAVAWGYARRPASELGADGVVDRFEHVPAIVERLARAYQLTGT
ncbi:MAG: phosphoglycolate phosphatase [Pseudomonadota bacterium]|jgi:phosphoglycolate phosphatase|nr:phosphoglycolate phosphatase [Pseudomonadota bacterium]